MKKGILICVFLSLLMMTAVSPAQDTEQKTNFYKPSSKMFEGPKGFLNSLIDPAKFSMSHSYSLSFYSMGGGTQNQGLYMNTMNYNFSEKLQAQARVAFLHQPLGALGMNSQNSQNSLNGKVFIQRAMLQYKPFKNTTLRIDYQVFPNSYMSRSYHGRRSSSMFYDPWYDSESW